MENEKLIIELLRGIDQRLITNEENIQAINQRLDGMDKRLDGMDQRLIKTEINSEGLHRDVRLLAEGQIAHREQNEREHKEIIRLLTEKTSVLEKAIIRNSKDIRELKAESDEIFEVLSKRRTVG